MLNVNIASSDGPARVMVETSTRPVGQVEIRPTEEDKNLPFEVETSSVKRVKLSDYGRNSVGSVNGDSNYNENINSAIIEPEAVLDGLKRTAGQLPRLGSGSFESESNDEFDENKDIFTGLVESSSVQMNNVFLASEDFYENEDEDDDEDLEDHDSEQEEFLYEAVVDQMRESVCESDPSVQLVTPMQANEIRLSLLSQGPHKFMTTYSSGNSTYTNQQLVAALGFNITTANLSDSHWMMYLFAAMRYATVTPRDRLPHPSNMDEFITVLDKAQRVLVVTGAGISTSLNIPDFRSSRGIYKQIEHMGLSDPQEVFDMSLFSHDPRPFYTVAHRILYDSDVYSPTHGFIKMLEDRGKLLRNYTQNIEDLEYKAGISRDKIVQCHGSFAGATCTKCGYKVPGSSIFPDIRAQKVARCPECVESYKLTQNNVKKGKSNSSYNSSSDDDDSENEYAHIGVMKPDIVFFGEPLPHRFHDLIVQDVLDCDLLICMGTSLQVSPVCDIPRYTPANVPQVYVSLQPAKRFNFDITFLGKCDDVVEMFLNKLNWKMTHSMLKGKFPGNLETDETKRYVIFREDNDIKNEKDSIAFISDDKDQKENEATTKLII